MKTKLLLYSALLLLTQCSKCKNDPAPKPPKDPLSQLPPETQTGAGTFGCLVNGKAYVAISSVRTTGDWQSSTRLAVGAGLNENKERGGQMRSISIVMNGQLLNQQSFGATSSSIPFPTFTPGINQFYAFSGGGGCIYGGGFIKTGQVELVKFDGVARIASGRFAFTLYEPGGCDTLRVTNGRFDVRF